MVELTRIRVLFTLDLFFALTFALSHAHTSIRGVHRHSQIWLADSS